MNQQKQLAVVLALMPMLGLGLPEAYQQLPLFPFKDYGSLMMFHYHVPKEVSRVSWQFIGLVDNENCPTLTAHIILQHGSFPVASPQHARLPPHVHTNSTHTYKLSTVASAHPNSTMLFHLFNPLPGDYFAAAYLPSGSEDITPSGLKKDCQYYMSSVATWSQTLDCKSLVPGQSLGTQRLVGRNSYQLYKYYVPEDTWSVRVHVSHCRSYQQADNSSQCSLAITSRPHALPMFDGGKDEINCTQTDCWLNTTQPVPMATHYLLLYRPTTGIVEFQLELSMHVCEQSSPNVRASPAGKKNGGISALPVNFSAKKTWVETVMNSSSLHVRENVLETDRDTLSEHCHKTTPLVRVKHLEDMQDVFLVEGRQWYTQQVRVSDAQPTFYNFKLLPYLDIGTTLSIGMAILTPTSTTNSSKSRQQKVQVEMCINVDALPQVVDGGRVPCNLSSNVLMVANNSKETSGQKALAYFPYPSPGHWFFSLQATCYDDDVDSQSGSLPETTECKEEASVYLEVETDACMRDEDDNPCGVHGVCRTSIQGQFMFAFCHCTGGWRGLACTDGSHAIPHAIQVLGTILLTASNIFFLPAIVVSVKRRFLSEAVIYFATMFFSFFYHMCDQDEVGWCLMDYDTLQFSDFLASILCFWVTLIAMARLPVMYKPPAQILGAVGITLAVFYRRMSILAFLVPAGAGLAIVAASWSVRCYRRKKSYPSCKIYRYFLLPGTLLAGTGLLLYAFVETEDNYRYTHSVWHILISLAVVFLLPRRDGPSPKQESSDCATPDTMNVPLCNNSTNNDDIA